MAHAIAIDITSALLGLLYSLSRPHVRRDILLLGTSPQKRWDHLGNATQHSPFDSGIDERIASLLGNRPLLQRAIDSCLYRGFIREDDLEDGSRVYTLSNKSNHEIVRSFGRDTLHILGLAFIAHVYPRDENLEPLP